MPTITLATVLTDAGSVATLIGPYVGIALAFAFGPRLLRMAVRLIKG
jgi:hypothetical protein